METYAPSTPTGVIKILPTTKSEVIRFSNEVIKSVQNGEANALELHVMLKAFEKASELITDVIRENVLREVDKYSEKSFDAFGANVTKSEVGTKYKYETAGDEVWETRKAVVDSAMSLLKEREEFLRTLHEPMTVVSEETGEVRQVRPPMKTSTTGLKVTLK